MTDQDKIAAFDDLRRRADEMGFACIGEALDKVEQDDSVES